MAKIIKKCLGCGTLNSYEAKICKKCESPLLAEVDQEDEILSIDPMEAALEDAVSEAKEDADDMVARILQEQAEHAKKIVAKEKEKEARKKKREEKENRFGFSMSGGTSAETGRYSVGGGASKGSLKASSGSRSGSFRISEGGYQQENEPGKIHLGGSLRVQAMKQKAEAKEKNNLL